MGNSMFKKPNIRKYEHTFLSMFVFSNRTNTKI